MYEFFAPMAVYTVPMFIQKFLGSSLSTIPYALLIIFPFMDRLRVPRRVFIALMASFWLINESFLIIYLIPRDLAGSYISLYLACMLVAYLAFCFAFVKADAPKLLFVFFLIVNYSLLITGVSNYVENTFFYETYYELYTIESLIINFGLLCLTYPFVYYFLTRKIRYAVSKIHLPMWKMVWINPAIFSVVTFMYTGAFETMQVGRIEYITMLVAFSVGAVLIFVLSSRMLIQNEKSAFMEQQINIQREHYMSLQVHIDTTKKAEHNLRQYMTVVQSYVSAISDNCSSGECADNIEKLREYLRDCVQSLPVDTDIGLCENFAVGSVLRYYVNMAKSDGVRVDTSVELPENVGISDSDLCVVFGNCVENAVEECRRLRDGDGKFIKIHSRLMGKMLVIAIENSFDGNLETQHGVFMSKKRKGEGIGISSVKSIVDKYGESAQFEAEGNVFKVRIILCVNRDASQDVSQGLTQGAESGT